MSLHKNWDSEPLKKRALRLIALVVAALLLLGTLVLAFTPAFAQAAPQYQMEMRLSGDLQALYATQAVTAANPEKQAVDSLFFHLYPNVYRRYETLPFEESTVKEGLYGGYQPGGIELVSVKVNGEAADWGVQGADESVLRVHCPLPPGGTAKVEIGYTLLIPPNKGAAGFEEGQFRLIGFYPAPAVYDQEFERYQLSSYTAIGQSMVLACAEYQVALSLPSGWVPVGPGVFSPADSREEGQDRYTLSASGVRGLALAALSGYRQLSGTTEGGVTVRVYAKSGREKAALSAAIRAVELYSQWFGPYPHPEYSVVESGILEEEWAQSGISFINKDLFSGGLFGGAKEEELENAIALSAARQWWGQLVGSDSAESPWLSEALAQYTRFLYIRHTKGEEAFLQALNREILPSLQQTIPGGILPSSPLERFLSGNEFHIVASMRGAAVMHEMQAAMGLENFLRALFLYAEEGQYQITVREDLIRAFDRAAGGSWEAYLDHYLINIGDYVQMNLDKYE